MSKQPSKSASMRPMTRPVADQLLLAIIDAYRSNSSTKKTAPAKKNSKLAYEKERERRLLSAKKALFGDTPRSGQPPLQDDVALRRMAREHLRDLTLTHLHLAVKRANDPPAKIRSIRELAELAAKHTDGYSQNSDSERLRRKFATNKKRYLEEERYGDDIEETFDAQALANLKEPLKRLGIELALPSEVERLKQHAVPEPQVAPEQQEVDWLDIEQRYRLLSMDLNPMYLPTQDERREYDSYQEDPFQWGSWTYPGAKERQERILEFNKDVTELDAHLEVIRKTIAARMISHDFVLAWGHLNAVTGQKSELMAQEEHARREFERGLSSGKTQRKDDERRWVASWLMKTTKGDKSKLAKARSDLLSLIDDVKNERRKPPLGYRHKVSMRIAQRISWGAVKKLAQM
jgi:hypothetical protein